MFQKDATARVSPSLHNCTQHEFFFLILLLGYVLWCLSHFQQYFS
jgi:hypothetical protein